MTTRNPNGPPEEAEAAWFVIRTLPAHEAITKTRMIDRLRTRNLGQPGMQIIVPRETLVLAREAEKYAGFILTRMHMYTETWKVLSNTPGVTGYIGAGIMPTAFPVVDWLKIPLDRFSNL